MGRLFGTDGARGIAVTELTCELAMSIGRAAATVLTRKAKHKGSFTGEYRSRGRAIPLSRIGHSVACLSFFSLFIPNRSLEFMSD